jgi:peptide/nickel transport system permease protein
LVLVGAAKFDLQMADVAAGQRLGAPPAEPSRTRRALGYLAKRGELSAGLVVLALVVLLVLVGPLIWTQSSNGVNLLSSLEPPSWSHPFGTDDLGRDVLARTLLGGRLDLLVALIVTAVGASIGILVGVAAATTGKILDTVIVRILDALLAFPPLILALAVAVALGANTASATIGITVSVIPYYARLMRSEVLKIKALPYVEAAVASGAGRARLLFRHVLPHTFGPMLIQASSAIGYAVLTLAALGFIGMGVQPPEAEWGTMISAGLSYAISGQWWLGVFPGLALLVFVSACSLIADGLSVGGRRISMFSMSRASAANA